MGYIQHAALRMNVLNVLNVLKQVRHPKVKERMFLDFVLMQKLAAYADRTPSLKWMNLGPSMEQFSHTMTAQVCINSAPTHFLLHTSPPYLCAEMSAR